MSTNRLAYRAGAAVAAAGIIAMAGAGTASAHVTAQPGEAPKGGYTKIAFRVPNERPDSGTIKLEVTLPAEHPLTSVRTKPLPGWKAQLTRTALDKPVESHGTKITEAVRTVTWTADSGVRINPSEFVEFEVSLGKLPENTDQLVLPAIQTYDNGEVVTWDAPPAAPGAEEPEHPAPVLKLVAKSDDGHSRAAAAPAANTGTGHSGSQAATSSHDDTARWIGGSGLILGALGLGFGAGALLRSRRASSGSAQ